MDIFFAAIIANFTPNFTPCTTSYFENYNIIAPPIPNAGLINTELQITSISIERKEFFFNLLPHFIISSIIIFIYYMSSYSF
jgi:hypothetical protein